MIVVQIYKHDSSKEVEQSTAIDSLGMPTYLAIVKMLVLAVALALHLHVNICRATVNKSFIFPFSLDIVVFN